MSMISRREFALAGAALALAARPQDPRWFHEHFVMDTWFWRTPELPIPDQASLVKRAGYTGMALSWGVGHAERLAALKELGLGVPGIYTVVSIDESGGPAWLPKLVETLKGSDARVWLALTSKAYKGSDPAGDTNALLITAKLAGLLQDAGLPGVAFYPHVGFWLQKVGDGVRLAEKLDRKHVGTVFNQYHWMAVEGGRDLAPTLTAALPRLQAVTINGSGLKPSILPIGEGDYDSFEIVRTLRDLGYAGEIGTQGYSIQGGIPERLEASRRTWAAWLRRLAEGK